MTATVAAAIALSGNNTLYHATTTTHFSIDGCKLKSIDAVRNLIKELGEFEAIHYRGLSLQQIHNAGHISQTSENPVYMGYIPEDDMFVLGYETGGFTMFCVSDSGEVEYVCEPDEVAKAFQYDLHFYNNVYDWLRREYPDIVSMYDHLMV